MLSAEATQSSSVDPQLKFGTDYTCNATICYGIGSNHSTLLSLQSMINKYAAAAGFKPVVVDGKIGDGTVAAFRKVAAWVIAKGGSGSTWKVEGRDVRTFENLSLAGYARSLIKTMDFWSTALPKAAAPAPAVPKPPIASVPAATPLPVTPSSPGGLPFTLPDLFNRPSAGSFGPPAAAPAPPSSLPVAPTIHVRQEKTPTWVWIVGGAILAGGVTTAVVLTSRRRRPAKG